MSDNFPSIVDSFAFAPLASAVWRSSGDLLYRDLALSSASSSKMSARHIRANGAATEAQVCAGASPFLFIIVLAGEVNVKHEGTEERLGAYDSASRFGAGTPVSCSFSHTAEIFVIEGNAQAQSEYGPARAEQWAISRESEDAYVKGDGPRAFFGYRDLGTTDLTDRRIHIHLVRAEQMAAGGTGWHHHTMGQIFYILRGSADLYVEELAAARMVGGDAMCISPGMRHTVAGFTRDYFLIEMCVPADYGTIDAPAAVEGV